MTSALCPSDSACFESSMTHRLSMAGSIGLSQRLSSSRLSASGRSQVRIKTRAGVDSCGVTSTQRRCQAASAGSKNPASRMLVRMSLASSGLSLSGGIAAKMRSRCASIVLNGPQKLSACATSLCTNMLWLLRELCRVTVLPMQGSTLVLLKLHNGADSPVSAGGEPIE